MPASPVVRTHAPRCTIWLYCYTPLVAVQICICWVNDQRRAVPGSIRSPHTISSRLVSAVSAVRVGVSRTIASPSPTSGLPRRPRLDRSCIVIIHKFYSVRLSSSEGTRSRGPSEISLRVLAWYRMRHGRVCAALLDGRQPRDTGGGRESDSRVEHRRGSRVGVRVFNSGAKATCVRDAISNPSRMR